jgi:hypothetical protein
MVAIATAFTTKTLPRDAIDQRKRKRKRLVKFAILLLGGSKGAGVIESDQGTVWVMGGSGSCQRLDVQEQGSL